MPAVKSPQTEKMRSTYASEAGAEMISSASGARRGNVLSDLIQKSNPVWTENDLELLLEALW